MGSPFNIGTTIVDSTFKFHGKDLYHSLRSAHTYKDLRYTRTHLKRTAAETKRKEEGE
jgi:hypothetical protein